MNWTFWNVAGMAMITPANSFEFFKKAKIVTFDTEADAASEVLNGKADAIVYDQPYNVLFMSDKGAGRLVHLDTPLTYEPLGWAIRKGDPDFLNWLNNFLRQMQEDKVVNFSENLYNKPISSLHFCPNEWFYFRS